jgi:hypothetical protein
VDARAVVGAEGLHAEGPAPGPQVFETDAPGLARDLQDELHHLPLVLGAEASSIGEALEQVLDVARVAAEAAHLLHAPLARGGGDVAGEQGEDLPLGLRLADRRDGAVREVHPGDVGRDVLEAELLVPAGRVEDDVGVARRLAHAEGDVHHHARAREEAVAQAVPHAAVAQDVAADVEDEVGRALFERGAEREVPLLDRLAQVGGRAFRQERVSVASGALHLREPPVDGQQQGGGNEHGQEPVGHLLRVEHIRLIGEMGNVEPSCIDIRAKPSRAT